MQCPGSSEKVTGFASAFLESVHIISLSYFSRYPVFRFSSPFSRKARWQERRGVLQQHVVLGHEQDAIHRRRNQRGEPRKKENTVCPKVLTTGMPRAYFPLFLTYWSDLKCKLKAEGGEVARIPRKAAEEQAGKPVIPAKTATQRSTLVTAQIKGATEKGN